jgi:transcriptional regulator with GAF, ATPase, and Fis domain
MFELADGGTILLDEIGGWEFKLQAGAWYYKTTRLRPGKETVRVDIGVIMATHCDLEKP